MKIVWMDQYSTGQIYSNGVEMALCSKKNEQIGPFVFCKDFFQDAIKGHLNGVESGIWGYKYNPKKQPPIDLDNIRILLRNTSDAQFLKKVDGVKDLLNQIEKKMGLELTKVYECESPPNKSGVALLVGDGSWSRSSVSLSMYTLLARNGLVHEIGSPFQKTINSIIEGKKKGGQQNDGLYLKYGKPGVDLILELGIDKVFGKKTAANYLGNVPTSTIHHFGGIVAFGSRHSHTVKQWPNWKFPEETLAAPGICFS